MLREENELLLYKHEELGNQEWVGLTGTENLRGWGILKAGNNSNVEAVKIYMESLEASTGMAI